MRFPYFPRKWTLKWVDLALAFPIDPRQPTQNTPYGRKSAVYHVLLSGTPLPYGILPRHLPKTQYYHMEPAPPAHEAERQRIWAEYIIDKLSADGYEPGVCREVDVRLVLAFHIQLRWAFGNYKKGGVPRREADGTHVADLLSMTWTSQTTGFACNAPFSGDSRCRNPKSAIGFPPEDYAGPNHSPPLPAPHVQVA